MQARTGGSTDLRCIHQITIAASKIRLLESGQDRTITGYEIKDVVLTALKKKEITDANNREKAIRVALQSMTSTGEIWRRATSAERINDSSFLIRTANLYVKNGYAAETKDPLSMMLSLGRTLEEPARPYYSHDLLVFFEYWFKQSEFTDIIGMLKEMPPDDNRLSIISSLLSNLSYNGQGTAGKNPRLYSRYTCKTVLLSGVPVPILFAGSGKSLDKPTTLRYADEAEQLFNALLSETIGLNNFTPPPYWSVKLHRFIWQSYLVAGAPEDAQKKLAAWIFEIKKMPYRTQRIPQLTMAAIDIVCSNENSPLALSLLQDAENEAKLIDNPKQRGEELEKIAKLRKWINNHRKQ